MSDQAISFASCSRKILLLWRMSTGNGVSRMIISSIRRVSGLREASSSSSADQSPAIRLFCGCCSVSGWTMITGV